MRAFIRGARFNARQLERVLANVRAHSTLKYLSFFFSFLFFSFFFFFCAREDESRTGFAIDDPLRVRDAVMRPLVGESNFRCRNT